MFVMHTHAELVALLFLGAVPEGPGEAGGGVEAGPAGCSRRQEAAGELS